MDVVIKITNPNCSDSYFLYIEGRNVATVPTVDEARIFSSPQKAKLEMLKLMLDGRIPKRNLSLEYQNDR